ncbi:MAG: polyprenol monophosphomannose synthase [Candidatus Altiarchaeota archaeon]|nr:polyprenol monophosphomannose synthase [Candidatus Altiarchaeota archaeon]
MNAIIMLPTYNEKENIAEIVQSVLSQGENVSVIVVDDDSPDGTGRIADQLALEYPSRVDVMHRTGVRGRASAGIAGFKRALELGFDCVIEMDADFSHDPKEIPKLLKLAEKYDVVVGSRYVPGGTYVGCKPVHMMLSRISNFYNRLVLGLNVRDTSGGFKCYRRKVLESIDLDHIVSWGYSIGPELLYKITRKGFSIVESPIVFVNRRKGKSKASMKVVFEYPLSVLKIRLKSD